MSEKHTPLTQFEINEIHHLPPFLGYDVSFTNSSLFMVLAVASITLLISFGMRKKALVPGRLQNVAEMLYGFVFSMVNENLGNDGRKYFPFIFSLFTFILFCNLLGMLPYSFTSTSHIVVTFSLAITVFFVVLLTGFAKHGIGFYKLFVPSGVPAVMLPLIVPIEVISFLARPISLSLRLAAAMTAGHIALKVFAGFVLMLWGAGMLGPVFGVILPIPILVALIGLEFFIAALQAYIFSMLTSIYLHDAMHAH
jgi:F-type H+-transporting ATPase subunit a